MINNGSRVRELIAEEAAEWFVENRAGLTARQRQEFGAWLKTSPVHVEEYLAMAALAQDMSGARHPQETAEQTLARAIRADVGDTPATPLPVAARTGRESRWVPTALAACAALLAFGLASVHFLKSDLRPSSSPATVSNLQTRRGEQKAVRLNDGSLIQMDTDTRIAIRVDSAQRQVVLWSGQAQFDVVHDSRRPFRVIAGPAEVTDVGTRFGIRLDRAYATVTVTEGSADVRLNSSPPDRHSPQRLKAGEQVAVSSATWPEAPRRVDLDSANAWLRRQIRFEAQPLAQVTDEFNRYATLPFEIDSPQLKALKVSGILSVDDPDAFIGFLRSLPGVRVEASAGRVRIY